MLFNSIAFIFGFLPLVLIVFLALGHAKPRLSELWLVLASLFFYGWWNPKFLMLLLGSTAFNYAAGLAIALEVRRDGPNKARGYVWLAIAGNLVVLGYFKYANFFVESVNPWIGGSLTLAQIVLPLGISFFTFTQIAFLVDVYQRKAAEFDLLHYALFVTYFPHLIAGPIIHHAQMMPQFADRRTYRVDWTNIAVGTTIFVIGLAKKVLLADSFGAIATPFFDAASHGAELPFAQSWTAALGYTLQLYFDFSGYSDMAIGLSLMFNIKMPLNFNSPYKADSIIDFWRRWHMTLSAFLRDYVYISLGGSRKGDVRRYANVLLTMLIGGLWHGAGWTFVAWGGLHGLYLVINHGFRAFRRHIGWPDHRFGQAGLIASTGFTFLMVVFAWVLFRAESFSSATILVYGMAGGHGLSFASFLSSGDAWLILVGLAAVWLLPNTQQFMRAYAPAIGEIGRPAEWIGWLKWQPVAWWSWASLGVTFARIVLGLSPGNPSEFLYYQF